MILDLGPVAIGQLALRADPGSGLLPQIAFGLKQIPKQNVRSKP